MAEEMLSLEFAKCRLLDEETKQKGISSSGKSEQAAFVGTKKIIRCYRCKKTCHKVTECPNRTEQKKTFQHKTPNVHYAGEYNDDASGGVCFVSGSSFLKNQTVTWIVDFGSSENLTNDRDLLDKLVPMKQPMTIAVAKEGESIVAKHSGDVKLFSSVNCYGPSPRGIV
uniref:CCHC-type domain-containing protein n=1 Tax=Anopheles funestus TaxID=62324 RepID=A0A182RHG6_ANOFN